MNKTIEQLKKELTDEGISAENCLENVRKNIAPYLDNKYLSEIERVKALGDVIGFGNMMDIALALWSLKLEDEGVLSAPASIPRAVVNLSSVNKDEQFEVMQRFLRTQQRVKHLLKTKTD